MDFLGWTATPWVGYWRGMLASATIRRSAAVCDLPKYLRANWLLYENILHRIYGKKQDKTTSSTQDFFLFMYACKHAVQGGYRTYPGNNQQKWQTDWHQSALAQLHPHVIWSILQAVNSQIVTQAKERHTIPLRDCLSMYSLWNISISSISTNKP